MARRLTRLTTAVVALAVAGGGLALAAPAQAAGACYKSDYKTTAACPTAVGIATTAAVTVPYTTGSAVVQLKAGFNDPASTLRDSSVVFTITGPGVNRDVYPTAAPTVDGTTKIYSATYTAYSIYKAGTYTVTAKAGTYGGSAAVATTKATTFVVKHQTRFTASPSKYYPKMGEKVTFSGSFYPSVDAGGQKLKVSFKAKGTKKWVKKGKAKVKANGKYKTKKVTMVAYGKWRLQFKGTTYLTGSKQILVYKKR